MPGQRAIFRRLRPLRLVASSSESRCVARSVRTVRRKGEKGARTRTGIRTGIDCGINWRSSRSFSPILRQWFFRKDRWLGLHPPLCGNSAPAQRQMPLSLLNDNYFGRSCCLTRKGYRQLQEKCCPRTSWEARRDLPLDEFTLRFPFLKNAENEFVRDLLPPFAET